MAISLTKKEQAQLEAIEPADTLTLPVVVQYHQDTQMLTELEGDAEALAMMEGMGLDPGALKTHRRWLDLLEAQQRSWNLSYHQGRGDEANATIEQGYTLRQEALRAATFHARDDAKDRQILARVRRGEGHLDMFEDLGTMIGYVEPREAQFERDPRFDAPDFLRRARALREDLDTIFGARSTASELTEKKELRDRLYAIVEQSGDTIREIGRYLFDDDAKRARYFRNHYLADRVRRHRDAKKSEQDTQPQT